MKANKLILAAAFCAVLSADAAVVRKLPAETVVEGESISFDSMGANSVRSSNTAVFSAALRARRDYVKEGQVFASRPVSVVPVFWQVLKKMFTDDPEIVVDIVGDKVVIGGYTANVDTLRRVDTAKALDPSRIVTQVSYSTAQIAELVKDFLSRAAVTNIGVNVVGREVCLSGRMYDKQSIEQLRKRVEGFVKDFPGMSVNTDELRIYKQKIMINIEFVQYSDSMSRNLGFSGPEKITAGLDWNFGYEHKKETKGGRDGTHNTKFGRDYSSETGYNTEKGDDGKTSKTPTDKTSDKATFLSDIANDITRGNSWAHNWSGGAHAKVDGVQATINLLKLNGAAKSLYSTTLSTQSGIEAEFQSGGTFNIMTTPGMASNGDMVSIEYGYIIKTTPLIIDANTVNLDFSLDNKEPLDNTGTQISRYQTKSKYLVRPGESIAISGYRHNSESEDKKGTPWLSKIPWIGPYLFGNTANKMELQDMLLVVTVNWALEDDGGATAARLDEMKNRKVEVEMP